MLIEKMQEAYDIATSEPDFHQPEEAMDWLALVFCDPYVNEARASFLEIFSRDSDNQEFHSELATIAEFGIEKLAKTTTMDQLVALTRSPVALREVIRLERLHKRRNELE